MNLSHLTERNGQTTEDKPVQRTVASPPPKPSDQLPPHSLEAEAGVLGCCLLDPRECIAKTIDRLRGGAESFYDLRHRTIYEVLVTMLDENKFIDTVSVQQVLRDNRQLERVGGLSYLAGLPDAASSPANLDWYLETVQQKHLLRRASAVCGEAMLKIQQHEGDADAVLDEIERDIMAVGELRSRTTTPDIKALVHQCIDDFEAQHQRQGALSGLATGFSDLDAMTDGLQPGEVFIMAARPSAGKSTIMLNIAEHVAMTMKQPVGIFSLEMTARSLVKRLLLSMSRLNPHNLKHGFTERDFPKLTAAAGTTARAPIFIDDGSGLSILQIRARARRMKARHNIVLLVVDYLQLVRGNQNKKYNREQEVASVSGGLKELAKELMIPVIVCAQLNRETEKATTARGRRPRISSLRESGSVEQDADIIGLLHREEDDDEDPDKPNTVAEVSLIIGKNRNGPTGIVRLVMLRSIFRFEQAPRVHQEDYPKTHTP